MRAIKKPDSATIDEQRIYYDDIQLTRTLGGRSDGVYTMVKRTQTSEWGTIAFWLSLSKLSAMFVPYRAARWPA